MSEEGSRLQETEATAKKLLIMQLMTSCFFCKYSKAWQELAFYSYLERVEKAKEEKVQKVSVHGGHSGQFCSHADDMLEEIIQAYIREGFLWVGITEHMPPSHNAFLYPEERDAGETAQTMRSRFASYIQTGRELQKKYADTITLFIAMETELYSGYEKAVRELVDEFNPDYIVGSIHHVDDIPIDYSRKEYEQAIKAAGSIDSLYKRYFDQQYEMLVELKPAVVGHFDLIRIFDEEYGKRLVQPEIMDRIERNLDIIKKYDLILDYNLRALMKGATEPYISKPILRLAHEKKIAVVPGDDSHGVANIGVNMNRAIHELLEVGFSGNWQKPQIFGGADYNLR